MPIEKKTHYVSIAQTKLGRPYIIEMAKAPKTGHWHAIAVKSVLPSGAIDKVVYSPKKLQAILRPLRDHTLTEYYFNIGTHAEETRRYNYHLRNLSSEFIPRTSTLDPNRLSFAQMQNIKEIAKNAGAKAKELDTLVKEYDDLIESFINQTIMCGKAYARYLEEEFGEEGKTFSNPNGDMDELEQAIIDGCGLKD